MDLPRGIRLRGDSFQVDVSYKGRREYATCETLAEAKLRQQELRAMLVLGKPTAGAPKATKTAKSWTLKKAFDTAMSTHWEGMKSEKTNRINGSTILAFFGEDCLLEDINTLALDGYIKHLKASGNADATINRKLVCLRKIMAVAQERGGCPDIPKMPKRKEHKGRVRFLSDHEEEQMVAILRSWGKDDQADAVVVLVDTGMRYGELLRLARRDIDFTPGFNKLREPTFGLISIWINKTSNPRSVPMTERVRDILKAKCLKAESDIHRLWPEQQYWLRYSWDRAKEHMGLGNDDQFVVHALRHTLASRLLQRGASLAVLMGWLGHTNISTTMRYSHLMPTSLLDVVHLLR